MSRGIANEIIFDTLKALKDKFWSNVNITNQSDCWEWKGYINSRGYGTFIFNQKRYNAHRVAWVLYCGKINEDMLICHKCDNRSCCNPSHLFEGTAKDNSLDMVNKGRWNGGRRYKLNEDQTKEIRMLQNQNISIVEIAKQYKINRATVYRAIKRQKTKEKKELKHRHKRILCTAREYLERIKHEY